MIVSTVVVAAAVVVAVAALWRTLVATPPPLVQCLKFTECCCNKVKRRIIEVVNGNE